MTGNFGDEEIGGDGDDDFRPGFMVFFVGDAAGVVDVEDGFGIEMVGDGPRLDGFFMLPDAEGEEDGHFQGDAVAGVGFDGCHAIVGAHVDDLVDDFVFEEDDKAGSGRAGEAAAFDEGQDVMAAHRAAAQIFEAGGQLLQVGRQGVLLFFAPPRLFFHAGRGFDIVAHEEAQPFGPAFIAGDGQDEEGVVEQAEGEGDENGRCPPYQAVGVIGVAGGVFEEPADEAGEGHDDDEAQYAGFFPGGGVGSFSTQRKFTLETACCERLRMVATIP